MLNYLQGLKASAAVILLVGVIPLLFGLLLEVVILMPVRVPLHQVILSLVNLLPFNCHSNFV